MPAGPPPRIRPIPLPTSGFMPATAFENMSMLKKGLCVIAIPLIFQLLFIAALFKAQSDSKAVQDLAIHTKDVIAQAETVSRLVVQAQNNIRGLVVAGDGGFAADYQEAAREAAEELAKLRYAVADNPDQQAKVDAITEEVRGLNGWLAETGRLATSGNGPAAIARVRSLDGKRMDEEVRGLVVEFLREEERLDGARRDRLARDWSRQNWLLAGAVALTVAFGVGLVITYGRAFAGRVTALSENASRLAEGKPLASPVQSRDELGRLDGVFHSMARTLRERERENEMFIYSVSHDLRSPLVNLQGFGKELTYACEALEGVLDGVEMPERERKRVAAIVEDDIKHSIHFILTAVTRLSAIIDALLRLSRAGRVEYRWQRVDVGAIATRVVEALRVSAEEKRAEIVVGDLPPSWGDPTAVEQVFANLLANAINYLDPARPGRIEVGALAEEAVPNGMRRLRTYYVKDNGLGIAEAHRPKLFLAFQRLHPQAAKGEGIGLAVIRRVVERHGGKIWVESGAGVGSTFFVSLPADSASEPAAPVGREQLVYGQGGTARGDGEHVA
jgi:signal transduction histidine kinase